MEMALGYLFRLKRRNEANDMGLRQSAGRLADAEITIFGISAQADLEVCFIWMTYDKALRPASSRRSLAWCRRVFLGIACFIAGLVFNMAFAIFSAR